MHRKNGRKSPLSPNEKKTGKNAIVKGEKITPFSRPQNKKICKPKKGQKSPFLETKKLG
jgi:hypothetical protein